MAYQWKTRDKTTPGGYYWTDVAVALLLAEQYATDQAAVTAGAADILSSRTILTITGTYHEATAAEVQAGVTFGPALAYEGTFGGTVQILGIKAA